LGEFLLSASAIATLSHAASINALTTASVATITIATIAATLYTALALTAALQTSVTSLEPIATSSTHSSMALVQAQLPHKLRQPISQGLAVLGAHHQRHHWRTDPWCHCREQ